MAGSTDFLEKYQLIELQDLWQQQKDGDKAAEKELRQCLQALDRQEAPQIKCYLQQPLEDPEREEKRKKILRCQKQSMVFFGICLALTIAVAIALVTKSELLYLKWLDGIVLAIAIALVAGVWICDDRGTKNRLELLQMEAVERANLQKAALEQAQEASDAAPEKTAPDASENPSDAKLSPAETPSCVD